ncbi:MAG: sulfotransferase domain-containing protein, partial [Acidobacteriota bacterium]
MKRLLARLRGHAEPRVRDDAGSWAVVDRRAIRRFERHPENPFLVSFPRTGSHWVRMVLELYFQRPLLTRTFFYPERTDWLLLHHHDLDLRLRRRNVIYLWRDPVDTVFSQLAYRRESLTDPDAASHWADLYAQHLTKWLLTEDFTRRKTIVRYERLRSAGAEEFGRLVVHLGAGPDLGRLEEMLGRVTREAVKSRTVHDPQVVNDRARYEQERQTFRTQLGPGVRATVLSQSPALK